MAKAKAKSTSVKKSIKSNKNKKFSLKNINFKKDWKKLSYLGLAGFLVLSSVGYAGWRYYEQESASAAGYRTIVGNQSYRGIAACRIGTTGVQLTIINQNSEPGVTFKWVNGGYVTLGPFQTVYRKVTGLNATTSIWGSVKGSYGSLPLGSLDNCPYYY